MTVNSFSAENPAPDVMPRSEKGPVAPPPFLVGESGTVAEAVTRWPGVIATARWDLFDTSRRFEMLIAGAKNTDGARIMLRRSYKRCCK